MNPHAPELLFVSWALGFAMHYYQFNIGDYKSHTEHLSEMEDLAYRRLLDWYYLHESPIPLDTAETARQIRMRSHTDCIATVLQEYFKPTDNGWTHGRADKEIAKTGEKSAKASESAKRRWDKEANAMRTHSEGNATHNTEPITQDTKPREKAARGSRLPQDFQVDMQFAVDQGIQNCLEESAKFRDYWNAQSGQRGVKLDWQATWRNWCRSAKKPVQQQMQKTFAERDREAGWARWEEQTGKIHPDRQRAQGHVIDITPRNLEIEQ